MNREIVAAPSLRRRDIGSTIPRHVDEHTYLSVICDKCVSVDYIKHRSIFCSFNIAFESAIGHVESCNNDALVTLTINGQDVESYILKPKAWDSGIRRFEDKHHRWICIFGVFSLLWSIFSIVYIKPKGIVLYSNIASFTIWSIYFLGELYFRHNWSLKKFFEYLIKK